MYKNHYLLQFVTASQLPQEMKEKKVIYNILKQMHWNYTGVRAALGKPIQIEPLTYRWGKRSNKSVIYSNLDTKKKSYDGSCSQADQHIKSPWLSQEVPILCKHWKLLVRQAVNSKLWQSSLWSSEQFYILFAFCLSHRHATLFWNLKLINSAKTHLMKNIIKSLQKFHNWEST